MSDPKPTADPATRYRVGRHVSRHIYDTWQSEPQADETQGDREVAITFDPALGPVIVEALNDREQARANAAADIHAAAEQRIEDLRAEFMRQRAAVERQAGRRIGEHVEPDYEARKDIPPAAWIAIDWVSRALLAHALETTLDRTPWEMWPEIGEHDWNRVVARAKSLVTPRPDDLSADVVGAVEYLARRATNDPALPEVTHG